MPKKTYAASAKSRAAQDDKQIKQKFLDALEQSDTLCEALEISCLPKNMLCHFLIKDKEFLKEFDKIVNLKLEIALLESALKSKSAGILSFSLINRLPKKYNKTKKEAPSKESQPAPSQIVYVDDEEKQS